MSEKNSILATENATLSEEEFLALANIALAKLLEDTPTDEELPEEILNLQDLEDNYSEPTDAGEHGAIKSGFSNPFAMHIAARQGDVTEIKRLISKGMNVNAEDHLSSRPLHVASLFGHVEAVKLLIKMGADVNDTSYRGETALHIALYRGKYDVACILIKTGQASTTAKNSFGQDAIQILAESLSTQNETIKTNPSQDNLKKLSDIIDTINVIADTGRKNFNYNMGDHVKIPLPTILKLTASKVSDKALHDKLITLALKISAIDPSEHHFVAAKNLLHVFPTGQNYELKFNPKLKFVLESEGNYPFYTTPFIKQSLEYHYQKLLAEGYPANSMKCKVYEKIIESFENAVEFVNNSGQSETWAQANAIFQEGKTVLLTTGWDGHFVADVLSKEQHLFGVANNGDRYLGHQAGLNFYRMNNPDKINPEFMHDILNNKEQIELEYNKMYEYELVEQVQILPGANQIHGNCALESLRTAVKGLAYIELLNQGLSERAAAKTAEEYHTEWRASLGEFAIDQYQSTFSSLQAKAFIDIFTGIHAKPTTDSGDSIHAEKIANILNSPRYRAEFAGWLKGLAADPDIDAVHQAFEYYGVNSKAIAGAKGILIDPLTLNQSSEDFSTPIAACSTQASTSEPQFNPHIMPAMPIAMQTEHIHTEAPLI